MTAVEELEGRLLSVVYLGISCFKSRREGKQLKAERALLKQLLYADIINWYV